MARKNIGKMLVPKAWVVGCDKEVLPEGKFEFGNNLSGGGEPLGALCQIVSRIICVALGRVFQAVGKAAIEVPVFAKFLFNGFDGGVADSEFAKLQKHIECG